MNNRGQFSLIIGIFILVLAIVLLVSLYTIYTYYRKSIENKLQSIDIIPHKLILKNLTIKFGKTYITTSRNMEDVTTGIADCTNITITGKDIRKIVNVVINYTNDTIIIPCVANSSLILTLVYRDGISRKYIIYLNTSNIENYIALNVENATEPNYTQYTLILSITSYLYRETTENIEDIIKKYREMYDVYYVSINYVPILRYLEDNSTYLYYLTYTNYNETKYNGRYEKYYFINTSIVQTYSGENYCNLTNISYEGLLPMYGKYIFYELLNCNVFRLMRICINRTDIYSYSSIKNRLERNVTIELVKALQLNSIASVAYTGFSSCTLSGNSFECSGSLFTDGEVDILFNTSGIDKLELSYIIPFVNGSSYLILFVYPSLLSLLLNLPSYIYVNVSVVFEIYYVYQGQQVVVFKNETTLIYIYGEVYPTWYINYVVVPVANLTTDLSEIIQLWKTLYPSYNLGIGISYQIHVINGEVLTGYIIGTVGNIDIYPLS